MTQTDRLIAYLRAHPGASSLDVTLDCGIVNVTGRVSDARAAGHTIKCQRRSVDHRLGYWLVEPVVERIVPLVGTQETAGLV